MSVSLSAGGELPSWMLLTNRYFQNPQCHILSHYTGCNQIPAEVLASYSRTWQLKFPLCPLKIYSKPAPEFCVRFQTSKMMLDVNMRLKLSYLYNGWMQCSLSPPPSTSFHANPCLSLPSALQALFSRESRVCLLSKWNNEILSSSSIADL